MTDGRGDNMATFGFLGIGNMGGALARALQIRVSGQNILLSNHSMEKANVLSAELCCKIADNKTIAKTADFIFLGVKPQKMVELLTEISPILAERRGRFVLVTMAAGMTVSRIQELAGNIYPVIRIMPNTPSAIGEGMILYTCGEGATESDVQVFLEAMAGAGRFSVLPETLMDAGTAVAGCGPAFVDLFLEALADGGVACGLPRATAMEYAVQMLIGSAKLVLESGKHPGVLKDAVCSPGGSTIQGVRALEQAGFRSAVMEAVIAAYEKSKALQ